jgi:hypothetical protein
MAEQLASRRALGDYKEDYFVLLAALSAPSVEVRLLETPIAGVSFRGADNTVNERDRSAWYLSHATFMHEILCDPGRNPFLWQLGKAAFGTGSASIDPPDPSLS